MKRNTSQYHPHQHVKIARNLLPMIEQTPHYAHETNHQFPDQYTQSPLNNETQPK
jgi:hypothetical protein